MMKTTWGMATAAVVGSLAAAPVLAQGANCVRYGWRHWQWTCVQWGTGTSSVPEINAGAGLLAVAAVAAVVLFVWERRRRAV